MSEIQVGHLIPKNRNALNMIDTIAGNLLLANGNIKSVAVTSCRDGDGKSTVALWLAYSLTLEGKRVVFVDTSENGAPFGEQIDIPDRKISVSDFSPDRDTVSSDIRNLYVIPRTKFVSETDGENAAFLSYDFVSELNKFLSENFDYVIWDAPSAGKTIEAAKISGVCDGSVFVVKYGKTKKKDVAEVANRLKKSGKPIIGCVINRVKFDRIISKKRYRFTYTPWYRRILKR